MKKTSLLILLFIYLLMPQALTLFNNSTLTNFTITGLSNPNKIVLESSGSKFVTWNINSEIRMYYTNGTLLCATTYPQQIQRIIWPSQYYPIILSFPGLEFSTLNESTCQPIKTFNLQKITNTTNSTSIDEVSEITFLWKNGGPVVSLSATVCIWQIDLNTQLMINVYTTMDIAGPRYQTTTYSKDYKYIYVVMTDASTGARTVRVWQTKNLIGKPIRQVQFTTSVSAIIPSSDNQTVICVGSSTTADSTNIYRFDSNGIVKNKATKLGINKALTIGDGNTVAMFQTGKGTMELVRAGDGKTIQNTTFTNSNYFLDADFKNKVMIVLDSSARVITYSYEPDEDILPPEPVAPEKAFPIWIIIVSVIVGMIILAVVLMYVFREKLPEGLRKKLPNIFNSKKEDGKQPLLPGNVHGQGRNSQPGHKPNMPLNVNPIQPQASRANQPPIIKPSNNYGPPNQVIFQQPIRDGLPPGMNDAQIIEAIKNQEQRKRQQQFQKRRRQQNLQRQQKQRKYRLEQEEREKRQLEYRRQREWEDKQRLAEIERRRREDYEREKIRREEMERLRREEQARRYYEYQKIEEEKKRVQMEKKRLQEIKRIQYQRYLQDQQQRRRYQGYQPYPQSQYPSSNPNIYIPPTSFNPQYNHNYPNSARQPYPQPQQRMDFVGERQNLIREEKPNRMAQNHNESVPMNKGFFVVKRMEGEDENDKNNDKSKEFKE